MGLHDIIGLLGIGAEKIIAGGEKTVGRVTAANPCWWLKVNKKAVRLYSTDGVTFPHIVSFEYEADGKTYTGKFYVNWNTRCPAEGAKLTVYYDKNNPANYAVKQ